MARCSWLELVEAHLALVKAPRGHWRCFRLFGIRWCFLVPVEVIYGWDKLGLIVAFAAHWGSLKLLSRADLRLVVAGMGFVRADWVCFSYLGLVEPD